MYNHALRDKIVTLHFPLWPKYNGHKYYTRSYYRKGSAAVRPTP